MALPTSTGPPPAGSDPAAQKRILPPQSLHTQSLQVTRDVRDLISGRLHFQEHTGESAAQRFGRLMMPEVTLSGAVAMIRAGSTMISKADGPPALEWLLSLWSAIATKDCPNGFT